MAITLPEHFERHVLRMVEKGRYKSAEAALEEAFHLLDVRDAKQSQINDSIREGFEQIARGEYVDFDYEFERTLFERAFERAKELRQAEQMEALSFAL